MSLGIPRHVWVVLRYDESQDDEAIAAYLEKDAAELHVRHARAAVMEADQAVFPDPEQEAAFDASAFPWDVGMDNEHVKTWTPSYRVEEVALLLHPDQFLELKDGAIAISAEANDRQARLFGAAEDLLETADRVLDHLEAGGIDTGTGGPLSDLRDLIQRVKGES